MQAAKDVLHAYLQVNRRVSEGLRGHFGAMNLTFPQTLVLTLLESDGPMPVSALAKATGSANSTISGVVDRLEKAELLRRVRSERDRRVIYVEVTEKYRSMQEQNTSYAMERFAQRINTLSEEQLEQVLTGLNLLNSALDRSKHKGK